MASLNKVMLIGNLTRDPEIKYTPKGMAIAELGLACNRRYTVEATGEKREEVTFIDVTLWGRQAELAKEYLTKGRPVYIEGRLQLDTWDDKATGQKRSKLKVTGETMQFLGGRNEGGGGDGGGYPNGGGAEEEEQRPRGGNSGYSRPPQGAGPSAGKPRPAPPKPDPDEDDDIPF